MKTNLNYTAIILVAGAFLLYFFQGCKNRTPDSTRVVNVDTARSRTAKYADLRRSGNPAFYYSSEVFTKKDLEAILAESHCDGIRIHRSVNDSGRIVLLITGVSQTSRGYEDLLPKPRTQADAAKTALYDENYNVIDGNIRCPNMCDAEGLSNP